MEWLLKITIGLILLVSSHFISLRQEEKASERERAISSMYSLVLFFFALFFLIVGACGSISIQCGGPEKSASTIEKGVERR
jgi:hypothetical protein